MPGKFCTQGTKSSCRSWTHGRVNPSAWVTYWTDILKVPTSWHTHWKQDSLLKLEASDASTTIYKHRPERKYLLKNTVAFMPTSKYFWSPEEDDTTTNENTTILQAVWVHVLQFHCQEWLEYFLVTQTCSLVSLLSVAFRTIWQRDKYFRYDIRWPGF